MSEPHRQQTMTMTTRKCPDCGHHGMIVVDLEGYQRLLRGAHAQDAFPKMDKSLREQIISGFHPECWDRVFASQEEA